MTDAPHKNEGKTAMPHALLEGSVTGAVKSPRDFSDEVISQEEADHQPLLLLN